MNLQRRAGDVLASEQRRLTANASGRGVGRVLERLVRAFDRSDDPLVRQAHAQLHIRRRVMGYTNQRVRASGTAGGLPGAEGAISKITVSQITRGQRDLGLAVQGAAGMLMGDDAPASPFQYFALGTPSISIAGGTDEIQRNHLGERVLGLPAEPRSDAVPSKPTSDGVNPGG